MEKERKIVLFGALGITAAAHLSCLFLGFNSFWDLYYVFENPFQDRLSLSLAGGAFSTFLEGNYHPLTLLSHSFDYTFWGNNPFGQHLSSYLIHLLNVLLVFVIVERLYPGGSRIKTCACGLTALIFGVHPLRVESVAWVTERKDVLFAFFYLLSILAYIRWRELKGWGWYCVSSGFFLLSVLSKAMAVSLPLAVLILDHCFLARPGSKSWKRSLSSAAPFIIIASLTALLAVGGQWREHLLAPCRPVALMRRLIEFPALLVFYVYQTLWPVHIAPIYPIGLTANNILIVFSWLLLGVSAVFALRHRREYPAFLPGIALSVVMLLPTGGLVRVGAQVAADRFSYLTTLPLVFGLSWALLKGVYRSRRKAPVIAAAIFWLGLLSWKTVSYTACWDQAAALTRQAYDRYPRDRIIEIFMLRTYNNAAASLIEKGEIEKALQELSRALRIRPDFVDSHMLRAYALARQGKTDEALAIKREICVKLAEELRAQGKFKEAVKFRDEALKLGCRNLPPRLLELK